MSDRNRPPQAVRLADALARAVMRGDTVEAKAIAAKILAKTPSS